MSIDDTMIYVYRNVVSKSADFSSLLSPIIEIKWRCDAFDPLRRGYRFIFSIFDDSYIANRSIVYNTFERFETIFFF